MTALEPWRRRTTTDHPTSIETTPRIAAHYPERLAVLVEGGVSRISMGVQSVNADTLASVNRRAQENMAEMAVKNLRSAGFRRVNVDIIFGLPRQTASDWQESVEAVLAMGVDSVTTYDCLYRGKGRALTKRTPDKPSPETYGALYDLSYDLLIKAGFHAAYGSVNFSRHEGESGTSPYFEGRLFHHIPYLGTGNYASSMIDDYWWFAPYGVDDWMKRIQAGETLPAGDTYLLPPHEMMAKQALLSLNFGLLDAVWFERRFGASLRSVYGDVLQYGVEQGWLRETSDGFGISAGQFVHMPEIRSLFYTDKAIHWLEENLKYTQQVMPLVQNVSR